MSHETAPFNFVLQRDCLGREDNNVSEAIEECSDAIMCAISNDNGLNKLYHEVEVVPLLNGSDSKLLTNNGEAVVVGKGKSGVVFLMKNIHTNQVVALKTFKVSVMPVYTRFKDILREALF